CPIDACWKACQEAEPNTKVLNVSCKASDMCSCSYEDECLASKYCTEDICRDYCKKAVPHGQLKTSMCINNYCHCNKTEESMRRFEIECSNEGCVDVCKRKDPDKLLLQARCNSDNKCDCVYKEDEDARSASNFLKVWNSFIHEDARSAFNFFNVWNSFIQSTKRSEMECSNKACVDVCKHKSPEKLLLQARCNSGNECDCVYKEDEDLRSAFNFLKVWNSSIRKLW
ncbi:hypothetical protein MTO96_034894, partial [Rhipicephalus appendiculatus]